METGNERRGKRDEQKLIQIYLMFHDSDSGVHDSDSGVHDSDSGVHDSDSGGHDSDSGVHDSDSGVHDSDILLHVVSNTTYMYMLRIPQSYKPGFTTSGL